MLNFMQSNLRVEAANGGEIKVESNEENRSEFIITLPIV